MGISLKGEAHSIHLASTWASATWHGVRCVAIFARHREVGNRRVCRQDVHLRLPASCCGLTRMKVRPSVFGMGIKLCSVAPSNIATLRWLRGVCVALTNPFHNRRGAEWVGQCSLSYSVASFCRVVQRHFLTAGRAVTSGPRSPFPKGDR